MELSPESWLCFFSRGLFLQYDTMHEGFRVRWLALAARVHWRSLVRYGDRGALVYEIYVYSHTQDGFVISLVCY